MSIKRILPLFLAAAGVFIELFATNSIAVEAIKNNQAVSVSPAVPAVATSQPVSARALNEWLMRINDASKQRTYTGTFVVSVAGDISSARIWHACDGDQQMERVETLTGAPRSIFRRNNEVVTFFPEAKIARSEQRESLGLFPNLLKSNNNAIADYYSLKQLEVERVAGFETDVVQLAAKDPYRYSYRIWTERKSGLVVKLQTLDAAGQVLEQAAFSELTLDAPVKMERLTQMMSNTAGHKLEHVELTKTTALAQGWVLTRVVPGFTAMGCYTRALQAGAASVNKVDADSATAANAGNTASVGKAGNTMQWIFSDGLATVSLFVESYDRKRHTQEGAMSLGATHMVAQRMSDWWLTAVGEVPVVTLKLFAQQLERKK